MHKDAYHFYRAHWSRAPMVHIASPHLTPWAAGPAAIKIYTGARRVTLQLNGVVFGTRYAADRIAVRLASGRNEIAVRTDRGLSDTVVWEGTS